MLSRDDCTQSAHCQHQPVIPLEVLLTMIYSKPLKLTVKGIEKAPAVNLSRLNTLRSAKVAFLTPQEA